MMTEIKAIKGKSATIKNIRKREGNIVPFDINRISNAISKAMIAAGEGSQKDVDHITRHVLAELLTIHSKKKDSVPSVEQIQDIVEEQLILEGFAKTAKAYILYRKKRAELREKGVQVPEKIRSSALESKQYFRNSLGEFIYYRTYSRWIEEEGRRETWIESVARYIDFMRENVGNKLSEGEYEEIRQAILNMEVMPSMRLMWSAGNAARKTNVAGYNCSFIAPTRLRDFGEIMYLSMCGTGVGFSVESQTAQQLPQVKRQTGGKLLTHVVEDSKEGWADALILGLTTWFSGKDISFDYSRVRPRGSRLKTMGGQSSGPEPLRALLDFAREKIFRRQGRRLSNIDVHDIICKIGEVVVMGGVRRSALISLSDLDDAEMRDAKRGQFYLTEPQRSMSNNSAVYHEKPGTMDFLDEWIALAKSGSGERGIFNRGGLGKQLPQRRWKVFKDYAETAGTNPCVPADAWVMTSKGARQVQDLIHTQFTPLVNGKSYFSEGFFKTGVKEVFEIRTKRGFMFQATADHPVLVVAYRSRKVLKTSWKKVQDLLPDDEVVLHNHKNVAWKGKGTKEEGWFLGSLLGDGNIQKNGQANLDYWGESQRFMMKRALTFTHSVVSARKDLQGYIGKTGYGRIQSRGVGRLAANYEMKYGRKFPTGAIEKSSSDFHRGFLQGWFDADGSVQGNQIKGISIRLSSNSLYSLRVAQRMLARLGIISTIYQKRREAGLRILPDGKGGNKLYYCNINHELVISGRNLEVFAERVNFSDPLKREKFTNFLKSYRRVLNREAFSSKVTEIISVGPKDVYDCRVEEAHAFDGNGFYLHNCGEIVLRSKQFCNLTEVVARSTDTPTTLVKKARIATILGTYQSMLTKFPYLSKEWKENCEEERLLGVSITGQWDCPAVRNAKTLQKMREEALRVNKIYAKRLGINASTCITCVKPSGTVSQLVDAASGMHPRHSQYYIRRIRISATDSLFKMLKDQGVPYHPEVGQTMADASTYVLEFPVKAPDGSIFRDHRSAIEQLDYWKLVKENYTEHNPSVTISIGEDEWIKVAHWLYENWDILGGLSFLPRTNHVYRLAPYEEITKEQYEEMMKRFAGIDYSKIVTYEKVDETQGAKELACVAGVCEV